MRNIIKILIVTIILLSIINGGCKKSEVNKEEKIVGKNIIINTIDKGNVNIKEWKYGFGLDEQGNPVCFDPNKYEYFTFYKNVKKSEIKDGEMIQAAFLSILDYGISISNAEADSKFSINFRKIYKREYSKDFKHKIVNNRNYISEDGKNWERLEIKYFRETSEKNPFGDPLILAYFKCSYFEGEYYLVFRL